MKTALIVLLGLSVIMVDGFDLQAIGFVAPEMARAWSADLTAFGPAFSAALAGSIVGALLVAPIERRIGITMTLIAALWLFGGVSLATAFVTDLHTLTLYRGIAGMGLGAAVPLVATVVSDSSGPRWRATLVIITLCGQPLGAILGSALCARYIPVFGWKFAFYLGGILPLILSGFTAFLKQPGDTQRAATRPLRALFDPQLRTITISLWCGEFCAVFFVYIIVNWLPGFARDAGYTLQTSILAISLFNIGGISGAILQGLLIDRYPPFRITAITFSGAAISATLITLTSNYPTAFYGATFLAGLFGYGGAMALLSLPSVVYPRALRPTATGWLLSVGRAGGALGPWLAGTAVHGGGSLGSLFYFASAAALVVTILLSKAPD